MTSNTPTLPSELPPLSEQHAAKFLERDYTQCFAQMSRYESLIWDICKFSFTAYTAVLGVAVGLYKYSLDNTSVDLIPPAIAVLAVGLFVGLSMYFLVVRNRVYFVQVARYVNEHRGFFLKAKPLGFPNDSKMFTNWQQPPYFSSRSSQTWVLHMIAVLNGLLLATLLYISLPAYEWLGAISGFVILIAVQLLASIRYLISREGKSASQAVFGKE